MGNRTAVVTAALGRLQPDGVARAALVTIGATVDSMSSVTSVSSLVPAVMVATVVVSAYT